MMGLDEAPARMGLADEEMFIGAAETRVLVVEDNEGDVRLLETHLEEHNHGIDMRWVSSLGTACHELTSRRVDAVLLDLGLPDARGMEGIRTIHEAHPEIPIVVLTGLFDEQVGRQAIREGADDFFVKGEVEITELMHALRYAAERRRGADDPAAPGAGWAGHTKDGLMVVDEVGDVKVATPQAMSLLGMTRAELAKHGFEPTVMRGNAGVVMRGDRKVGLRVDSIDWDGNPARLVILSPLT